MSHQIFSKVTLVGIFLYLLILPASAQTTPPAGADNIINEFMELYNVPGLSFALAREGHIVLAKAYGVSSTENAISLNTSHTFRIASVSKIITSIMIMSLIEQELVSLDSRVFGNNGVLSDIYSSADENTNLISIQNLLQHEAGVEWTNRGDDPMFAQPQFDHKQLIQWVLDNRPISEPPGSGYSYSNFGYSVLGRVIESVTGMSYLEYFQELTSNTDLQAFTITSDINTGGVDEVQYYSQGPMAPYSIAASRMDAHGGWITTPTAMVKLMLLADGFNDPPDILLKDTIDEMTRPSKNNEGYAKGWSVNKEGHWWHSGLLPGTTATAVRTENGYIWAIFLNTHSLESGFISDFNELMPRIIEEMKEN